MLDYKLLEAFGAVLSEGGFEKGARKLHLTQSAVSQRIKLLEDQCGQVLLQRTNPPQPTKPGKILLAHFKQVVQLENDLAFGQQDRRNSFTRVAIGVNADTLATWFPAAVEDILKNERITLDIRVDDQDNTHELLHRGEVWGCTTTKEKPQQGCRSTYLGKMVYGVYCSPEFAAEWFPKGFSFDELDKAPMALFNRKDDLNRQMFDTAFMRQPDSPPTFFIPSAEKYANFVCAGHCYGILPHLQAADYLPAGKIINLSPHHSIDVRLYWHCWSLKSPRMASFDTSFTETARKLLQA